MTTALTPPPILLGEVGSRSRGTEVGTSDSDFMGIAIGTSENVLGLNPFEGERIGGNAKTKAVDVEGSIYSLRKWAGLAAKGNPSALDMLFLPNYSVITDVGQMLLDNKNLFISKDAGNRYIGYLNSQKLALVGERNGRTNRPDLVEAYGYDTKFAYHALRLGIEGVELMSTGNLHLPLSETDRENLLSIRRGEVSLDEVLDMMNTALYTLDAAKEGSPLPDRVDADKIDALIRDLHFKYWDLTI